MEAGAKFLVSPVWLPELARRHSAEAIPGAATPSEIWQAHSAGVAAVKVFPITRRGGASYIHDLLAPLPELTLMATGGVDIVNARELLEAVRAAVGVGTVTTGDDRELPAEERARRFLRALLQGHQERHFWRCTTCWLIVWSTPVLSSSSQSSLLDLAATFGDNAGVIIRSWVVR